LLKGGPDFSSSIENRDRKIEDSRFVSNRNRGGEIIGWEAEDIAEKAEKVLKNYENYKNSGIEVAAQFEKKKAIKNYADKLKELIK